VVDLSQPLPPLPTAEAVVHLAQANVAFPEGAERLFAVNTASTVGLLEHARRSGAEHFVFASSASVYGFGGAPFGEDDPPRATDFYSATKLAAERLVGAYEGHFATTILRLVAPYGPGQLNRLIPALVDRIREGRAVELTDGGRPRMNPIYVDDVVRTFVAVLDEPATRLLNVGGDEVVGIDDLARTIGHVLGVEPVFEERRAASGDLVVTHARLKELLRDHVLVSLSAGIRRTVEAPVWTPSS
jgi:nucleoside-diphosphate-sugar epimerase